VGQTGTRHHRETLRSATRRTGGGTLDNNPSPASEELDPGQEEFVPWQLGTMT
jgi:hypothetical protein